MRLDGIVAWYQKKIGSYDKQQWEKTLEERIISIATNLPLKSTKLKTDLIDVDLVRGSTFPKAKPKQSLLTVLYLSLLRFFFLPVYAKWWIKETSPKVFLLLLFLYVLQMTTWALFSLNIHRADVKDVAQDIEDEHIVSLCELLIPMGLGMLLCFIHSQIVATSCVTKRSNKRKHLSPNFLQNQEGKRRKKKIFRSRSNGSNEMKPSLSKILKSDNSTYDFDTDDENHASKLVNIRASKISKQKKDRSLILDIKNKLDLNEILDAEVGSFLISKTEMNPITNCTRSDLESHGPSQNMRKRNVNWDSPIKSQLIVNYEISEPRDLVENQPLRRGRIHTIEDDGFESFTGKSSSGEENRIFRELLDPTKNMLGSGNVNGSKTVSKESSDTDEENDDCETMVNNSSNAHFTEGTTSATENNIGVTTNSDDYSSELDQSESQHEDDDLEFDVAPTAILNPNRDSSERVSCTIFHKHEVKKAEMSVLDIASAIIERVERIPETSDYIFIGLILSIILALTPTYCRLCDATFNFNNSTDIKFLDMPVIILEKTAFSWITLLTFTFGKTNWEKTVLVIAFIQRLILTFLFFFLLAVAERTFKQRFLYAKLFSHLTSSRRAKKSFLPHFRLHKVKNIKAWLSVRSYLKRLGPQRSVDTIVSAAFITTLLLLAFLSLEFLKDTDRIHSQLNLEALIWSCALGTFLLRFMTLGTKINKKYRSISVLITEQINLYVQIEQKPQKKEELMISNSVLKLAGDLLKELESPFKISGISANSYLYNTVKVVILSALSGVLSEMLGFKLKLHKIKIK